MDLTASRPHNHWSIKGSQPINSSGKINASPSRGRISQKAFISKSIVASLVIVLKRPKWPSNLQHLQHTAVGSNTGSVGSNRKRTGKINSQVCDFLRINESLEENVRIRLINDRTLHRFHFQLI